MRRRVLCMPFLVGKVERDCPDNVRRLEPPGSAAFLKCVPNCIFPKRCVEHDETGLIRIPDTTVLGWRSSPLND